MDVFEKLGIKIPNALLVEGTTMTESDEEVIDFLKRYGKATRTEVISDTDSEFHETIVIEYESTIAIETLRSILPYTFVTKDGKGTYCISTMSTVYSDHIGKSKTTSFMAEMEKLAKVAGLDYAQVLQTMMNQIGHSVSELCPAPTLKKSPGASTETVLEMPQPPPPPPVSSTSPTVTNAAAAVTNTDPQPSVIQQPGAGASTSTLTAHDMNPPGIQRYVVEHIVKNEDSPMHHLSAQRLRPFSGRTPRPSHEVDYETWRTGVELLLNDPAVSDLYRSRRIVDSLLPPAVDLVRHLSHDTLPAIYLQTLESAFGTVQDGEELFAKFMDTFQNTGEQPSAYLQRLQVALNHAVRRGGVAEADVNRHLLAQFCRGCWNDTLISELQLKQKKSQPPPFAELLLLLRTEEDREASKSLRMKQHLGATKQKVAAHAQVARTDPEEEGAVAALTTLTQQLAQQLADVQKQLSLLTASQVHPKPPSCGNSQSSSRRKPSSPAATSARRTTPSQPRAGYCFRCGEDGHIRPQCNNEPNSALVALKRKEHNKAMQNKSSFRSGRDLN